MRPLDVLQNIEAVTLDVLWNFPRQNLTPLNLLVLFCCKVLIYIFLFSMLLCW